MIQDYFSVSRKSEDYFVLRVINKVDFAEEVVWAGDYEGNMPSVHQAIAGRVLDYLIGGFDSLDGWKDDREGLHESIQHFGFDTVIDTMTLVPKFLLSESSHANSKADEGFLRVFFTALKSSQKALNGKTVVTYAGALYRALEDSGMKSFKPKDDFATLEVPFEWIFSGKLRDISALLENYA